MNKKPTGEASIHDVAKLADVSIATVSRVFNRKGNTQEDTLHRVLKAAETLGYRTDIIPEILHPTNSDSKNSLVIFNIASLNNPFYCNIFEGALSSAKTHNYDLLISEGQINNGNVTQYKNMYKRINANGLISTSALSPEALYALNRAIPTVQCGEFVADSDISSVSIDDYAAAKRVMEYMVSLGRTKIALINGPSNYKYARERQRGYIDGLKANGISYKPQWIIQLRHINADMAFSAGLKLFSDPNYPNAVFTVSDVFATGIIRAAQYNGIKVPEDVIVVGFDNIDISSMMIPSITTVKQPLFQLGYIAGELLFEKMDAPQAKVQHILLDTELIIRESSSIDYADDDSRHRPNYK